jgi:guanylate kinase
MKENILLAFIGVAASGKTEIANHVVTKHDFLYIQSLTTRAPRPGIKDDYKHVTKEQFEEYIKNGELLEYTCFNSNYYGKLKKDVTEAINKNHSVYTLTADRVREIKKLYPKVRIVCVHPEGPTLKTSEKRLRNRGFHSEEEIKGKLQTVRDEIGIIEQLKSDNLIDFEVITKESDYAFALDNIDRIIDSLK